MDVNQVLCNPDLCWLGMELHSFLFQINDLHHYFRNKTTQGEGSSSMLLFPPLFFIKTNG